MKGILLLSFLLGATTIHAQDVPDKSWNIHFQATYIYQYKPSFHSPYSGANSLTGKEEKQNSLTATLFAGVRLWKGAEFYLNPELAGGSGLSGALGMGGSSNGETFRVGDPAPTLYLGRAYLQQTFALGSRTESTEEEANDLGGLQPRDYLQIRAGKFSLGDIFDNNEFSNAPRTQFMNWALMNNGAWDYAANVRGYTYSVTGELKKNGYGLKGGISLLPETANGAKLNTHIGRSYALNFEASKDYRVGSHEGNIRLLYFRNRAPMGNYAEAIKLATTTVPDIVATRKEGRIKNGVGLSVDQQLTDNTGLFARAGWNDGKNETWCFTEIDKTLTAGLSFDGKAWKRDDDNAGVALLTNGLSSDHRQYLKDGGYGFIVGDGTLAYAPEYALELYYSMHPAVQNIWITVDYQLMANPAYNRDRGPVSVFSARVHVEL